MQMFNVFHLTQYVTSVNVQAYLLNNFNDVIRKEANYYLVNISSIMYMQPKTFFSPEV